MPTYDEVSRAQLVALSEAIGQSHASPGYIDLQARLMAPWGAQEIVQTAPYPSLVGDDHSPYEYSVAYGVEATELRLLFEAQAPKPSLMANHAAALHINERIRNFPSVSLARFERIEDLFSPPSPAVKHGFSLWHAACLSPDGTTDFKVYLNPQLHGREAAEEIVDEVFSRLGFEHARRALNSLRRRGAEHDELKYVSLDLSDAKRARLKVYVCHHEVRSSELERAFSVAPTHRPGDAAHFCSTMAPQTACFAAKPISSCLAFVSGDSAPHTVTMHLPIAHYAESDLVASQRIHGFMARHRMDQLAHKRVLRAISRRPLGLSSGVQSYASYRRQGADLRLTVYLSPELFRMEALPTSLKAAH